MKIVHLAILPLLALAAISLFSFFHKEPRKDWDPDAGVVVPFSQAATVFASSNPSQALNVVDGDEQTAWMSNAPLPEGFIGNKDQNSLLGQAEMFCTTHQSASLKNATDGNLSTVSSFPKKGNECQVVFDFKGEIPLYSISLKCQVQSELKLRVLQKGNGEWLEIGHYTSGENYSLKRIEIPGGQAAAISLASSSGFDVFEIAGLATLPKEFVILDFGETKPVGVVQTRHWAGDGTAAGSKLFLSENKQDWVEISTLDPSAVQAVITNVEPPINARYIKIEHTLNARDWNKVFVWEVKAYDQFGPYGPRPPASAGHTKIKDLLGVNGYWSWGTDQYSDLLAPDGGPYRYKPVASHARNYHDMTWDIASPSDQIDYDEMAAGKGTPAKSWLNWDREYKAWHDAGLTIQASLQFFRFLPEDWKNPQADARAYAKAFVAHFGPKKGNGLVCSIEVGNEPWRYPSGVYQQILQGMISGAKEADPFVEVFPCALQAADPSMEKSDVFKNYIGARISKAAAEQLDGINIHAYSYAPAQNGQRKAVHPEHPNSTFWEILNAVRWRDQNMPGKKIYLSEWGWDHDGGGEDCAHDECVSEEAAACYAVRGALIALRMGIDRATWFFYANEKRPSSLYTRSGLTGSFEKGFAKKQSFKALESLVAQVGNKYFLKTVREDERGWIYLLGNADGTPTHLVAWRPVDGDNDASSTVTWKSAAKPVACFWLDGSGGKNTPPMPKIPTNGTWELQLSARPLLISLEP
ncbi:MAG: discoidin domain-containing protein [Saprospiraceae bacterium]